MQAGRVRIAATPRSIEYRGEARGLSWIDGRLWLASNIGVDVMNPESGRIERSVELSAPF